MGSSVGADGSLRTSPVNTNHDYSRTAPRKSNKAAKQVSEPATEKLQPQTHAPVLDIKTLSKFESSLR